MIVALVQPYFFPYIGYFQLMHAVDCFVFYDDAQFMKGGWVNRNRILRSGSPAWWTFPVVSADYKLPINQRSYAASAEAIGSLAAKIDHAYRKAPHFKRVFAQLTSRLQEPMPNVAEFNQHHVKCIAQELGIDCQFAVSSEIDKDAALDGQARVIDICRRLGATTYINPIGGLELYDPRAFESAGIELRFIKARPTDYAQFGEPHVPFLSIVDVLMFNGPELSRALLDRCDFIAPSPKALS